MNYYIRDLLFNKLMTAYGADDPEYPVPGAGPLGVLLRPRDGREPSVYRSPEAAREAIEATIRYGHERNLATFTEDIYQICSGETLKDEAKAVYNSKAAKRARARAKRKVAEAAEYEDQYEDTDTHPRCYPQDI